MGDRLEEGQKLGVGESLTSKNGAYKLILQEDGNLVLYAVDDTVVWAAGTDGRNAVRAEVQDDGNFVLYTKDDEAVWATQTKGAKKVLLVLQDDRNLVLYSKEGPVWKTDTNTDEPPPVPKSEEAPPVVEAEVAPAASEEPIPAPVEEAPAPPPPPPPPPAPRTYTVVSGDTLWAIAERYYGDGSKYPQIAEASGISNPDLIHPGQVLTIP